MQCFRLITLPLILPAVAAGSIFAFLASFDETVVSFFISGVEHKTITRKLMEDIEFNPVPADCGCLHPVRGGDHPADVGWHPGERWRLQTG